MNIRLNIEDAFLREMQEKIGNQATAIDLVREGLTLFNWAIDEVTKGRVVLSSDTAGTALKTLVLPSLSFIEQHREQTKPTPAEQRVTESAVTVNDK